MQIGLTKKLSDAAGIQIAPADAFIDPLFSWSANLLTIHRKKTIVCMNDASRFGFFLHGVRAADYKRMDQLILDGMRQCMAEEAIAPEVVERYLSDASADQRTGRLTEGVVAKILTKSSRHPHASRLCWRTGRWGGLP
jgi:hypothetical protein